MRSAGGEIVAVSKDGPDDLAALARTHGLELRLLSDPDLRLVDAFGLRHAGADVVHGGDLARPAVLFFDASGILRDRFLPPNTRERITSAEALAHVRALP